MNGCFNAEFKIQRVNQNYLQISKFLKCDKKTSLTNPSKYLHALSGLRKVVNVKVDFCFVEASADHPCACLWLHGVWQCLKWLPS